MKRMILGFMLAAAALSAGANDMTTKTFKDLDKNADGKLSATEVGSQKELTADFRTADANGDGMLSETEYDAWTAARPTGPGKSQTPTSKTP